MSASNGGPAFPFEPQKFMKNEATGEITPAGSFGMSLLDYFAGQTMQSILLAAIQSGDKSFCDDMDKLAQASFLAAASMVKESIKCR